MMRLLFGIVIMMLLVTPVVVEDDGFIETVIGSLFGWMSGNSGTTSSDDGEGLGTAYAVDYHTTPPYGSAPLMVRFTAVNDTDLEYTHWNFGDGYSSTERDHWHTYEAAGTYTATLTVGNATWNQTAEIVITVEPPGVMPLPTDAEEMF